MCIALSFQGDVGKQCPSHTLRSYRHRWPQYSSVMQTCQELICLCHVGENKKPPAEVPGARELARGGSGDEANEPGESFGDIVFARILHKLHVAVHVQDVGPARKMVVGFHFGGYQIGHDGHGGLGLGT